MIVCEPFPSSSSSSWVSHFTDTPIFIFLLALDLSTLIKGWIFICWATCGFLCHANQVLPAAVGGGTVFPECSVHMIMFLGCFEKVKNPKHTLRNANLTFDPPMHPFLICPNICTPSVSGGVLSFLPKYMHAGLWYITVLCDMIMSGYWFQRFCSQGRRLCRGLGVVEQRGLIIAYYWGML